MVRLTDLKQRITPLTRTKPRLHQSYFDLHDLGRKSTVFDKLKRRFSQSDNDLSKLVTRSDFKSQQSDDGLIVYNVMSSLTDENNSHVVMDNDVDQKTLLSSKALRRDSATFDDFSDILDMIQGNVVGATSELQKEERAVACVNDRDFEHGLTITNGHTTDQVCGGCRDSSVAYARDEKFGLNIRKNERLDVHIDSNDFDSDNGKTLIDCSNQQISSGEKVSSKNVPHLSQNHCANEQTLVLNDGFYIDDNVIKSGAPSQMCGPTYQIMRTGLDSSNAEHYDSAGKPTNTLKSVVRFPFEIQSLMLKGINLRPEPSKGHSLKGGGNEPPSCSIFSTVNSISDRSCDRPSNHRFLYPKNSNHLTADGSFPMDCAVDKDRNSGVGERLNLGNYECYEIGYIDKTGADVRSDLCRCTPDHSITEKSSCQNRLPLNVNITASETLATGDTWQEHKGHDSDSVDIEMPLSEEVSLECIGVGATRERAFSGGRALENRNEQKTRTRRLHSAPNLHAITEEEKTRLEKAYVSNKQNKRCSSLKSAMKKRSADQNGNALRVRFDLSKTDEDLDKIRSDRDGLKAVRRRSLDICAKPTDKDEQKKSWVYVVKKFRIKNELAGFDTLGNPCDDKDRRLSNKESERVKNDRDMESAHKNETEIHLESVKEFRVLQPARRIQVAADKTKHSAMDQTAVQTPPQSKIGSGKWPKPWNGAIALGASFPLLHVAASTGKTALLSKLISVGVNLNEKDSEGWPAIHYAISNGHFNCAALLIEHGANINCYTDDIVKDYCKAIRELHLHRCLIEDNSM